MKMKSTNTMGFRLYGLKNISYGLIIFGLIFGLSGVVSACCDVGNGTCYVCGQTIYASCTLNASLNASLTTAGGKCFFIGADNIVIDGNGYNITGDGLGDGITLNGRNNATIKNFNIYNFELGILLYNSSNNTLVNNTANSNWRLGIYLGFSSNNILNNNTATYNTEGIYLSFSSNNNILTNNKADNNYGFGIEVGGNNNTLINNIVNDNWYGILVIDSEFNTLTHNTANNDGNYGFRLHFSSNNILTDNIVSSNDYGFYLYSSSNNTLKNNHLCFNNILILDSYGNNITCDSSCEFYCNPDIEAANDTTLKNDFVVNEPIYAKGINVSRVQANNLCVYITANRSWNDGDDISPYISMHTVNTTGDGSLNSFLENASTIGYYDMVLDVDCDGRYNAYRDNVDIVDENYGFYITPEPMAAVLFIAGLSLLYGLVVVRKS